MKTNTIGRTATVGSTLALFSLLLYLPFTACDGTPPCTPTIKEFKASPKRVCDANTCGAGANATAFYITVEFRRYGILDTPSSPKFHLLKGNSDIPNFDVPPAKGQDANGNTITIKGVYQLKYPDKVDADTWFELQAYGDDGSSAHKRCKVEVRPSYYDDYKMSQSLDSTGGTWFFKLDSSDYSEAVVIYKVENRSADPRYDLKIKYGGKEPTVKPGASSLDFNGLKLGGTLQATFLYDDAREDFQKDPQKKDFSIRVYYICKPG